MPTVLRLLNWRFHFYSDEGQEPPHIHVRTPDGECKFWLSPVRLAKVEGVKPVEVRRIEISGHLEKPVIPAKAGIQLLELTGLPPSRERRIGGFSKYPSVVEHEALFLEKWHEHNQS